MLTPQVESIGLQAGELEFSSVALRCSILIMSQSLHRQWNLFESFSASFGMNHVLIAPIRETDFRSCAILRWRHPHHIFNRRWRWRACGVLVRLAVLLPIRLMEF